MTKIALKSRGRRHQKPCFLATDRVEDAYVEGQYSKLRPTTKGNMTVGDLQNQAFSEIIILMKLKLSFFFESDTHYQAEAFKRSKKTKTPQTKTKASLSLNASIR